MSSTTEQQQQDTSVSKEKEEEKQQQQKQKVVEETPTTKKTKADYSGEGDDGGLTPDEIQKRKAVEEANAIARDLGFNNISFVPKFVFFKNGAPRQLIISVLFSEEDTLIWSLEKFVARFKEMKLIHAELKKAKETRSINDFSLEAVVKNLGLSFKNPFLDDEDQFIGEANVWLQSLANMIDASVDPPILNLSQSENRVWAGRLNVSVLPLDKNEGAGPWDETPELDPFVEEPTDMIGREIHFAVQIDAISLETAVTRIYKDVYVRYKINEEDSEEEYTTTKHYSIDQFQPIPTKSIRGRESKVIYVCE